MERLESLNLPSLLYRRKGGNIIQTYKYIQGLSKGDVDKLLPVPSIDAPEDIQQNLGRLGVIQNSEYKASPIEL
jgi:hypothetical protein